MEQLGRAVLGLRACMPLFYEDIRFFGGVSERFLALSLNLRVAEFCLILKHLIVDHLLALTRDAAPGTGPGMQLLTVFDVRL